MIEQLLPLENVGDRRVVGREKLLPAQVAWIVRDQSFLKRDRALQVGEGAVKIIPVAVDQPPAGVGQQPRFDFKLKSAGLLSISAF